jgi:hypothetical protein
VNLGRDPALDHRAQVQDQTSGAAIQRGRQGDRRHASAARTAVAGTHLQLLLSACANFQCCLSDVHFRGALHCFLVLHRVVGRELRNAHQRKQCQLQLQKGRRNDGE